MNKQIFGDVISTYTVKDTVEDGIFCDVEVIEKGIGKEAGFTIPVYLSSRIYEEYVKPSEKDAADGQDLSGRLWDTLYMLHVAIKSGGKTENMVVYKVIYVINRKQVTLTLWSVVQPYDETGAPCVTIFLPEEY